MRRYRFAALAVGAILTTAALPSAQAQLLDLSFGMEGYYRTRGIYLSNLAPEPRREVTHPVLGVPVVYPTITRTSYITHRLRLSPNISFARIARLFMQFDGFDDVIWGDNNGIASAPLFAVPGSNQYFLGGGEQPTISLTRAWIEFGVPVGLLRVGRMPSHWGMGLLANGGGSANWDPLSPPGEPRRKFNDTYFDEDFGDNHFGSTQDRILFATKPLQIVKTIQKSDNPASNLITAYAFDKLSESPLLAPTENDRLFRPFGQQGFISRGSPQDDVNEHVFVLAYVDPDWNKYRYTDMYAVGAYGVFRTQDRAFTAPSLGPPHTPEQCAGMDDPELCVTKDEGSFVYILDAWFKLRMAQYYAEAEAFYIGGHSTGGIPLPAPNIYKEGQIAAGAARVGLTETLYDAILEVGYNGGDEDLFDKTFKQRPNHPDYNVGLILFEEVVRERAARIMSPLGVNNARIYGTAAANDVNLSGAKGLMTSGGVVNAKYLYPKIRLRPGLFDLEFVGAAIFAWVDKWAEFPAIFKCPQPGVSAEDCTASKYLGTEIDFAIKSKFADDHMDFSLETGYLHFGDVLKTGTDQSGRTPANVPDGAFTVQARVAFVF